MKDLKTLKQLHDEEHFKYLNNDPDLTMEDYIYPEMVFAELKNNLVVCIEEEELQTSFPFPYSASVDGDYEEKLAEAKSKVNLEYAISVNTENIDFVLEHLRVKPDMKQGALYLVRENQLLPEDSRFRVVKFLRTYPDMAYMGSRELESISILVDADDRKAIYSAYKKARSNIVKRLSEWHEKYRHNAFEIIMYNQD